MNKWIEKLREKDKRTIARIITKIEKQDPDKDQLLELLFPLTGNAFLVGITGSPGAGKSSLLDRLIETIRAEQLSVGVIAVDPTSPFTGGAILGDRVRMTKHALDEQVFIRSMGSRGSLGGLARATKEAVWVLDAAGYDVILIETVGVGQAELDIMHVADTVALVMNPGAGDVVQVFKAGIMEIADMYIVNKADLPGAARLVAEIEELLDLIQQSTKWRRPIVQTVTHENRGIEECWQQLQRHRQYLQESGEWIKRRQDHMQLEVWEIIEDAFRQFLRREMGKKEYKYELEQVAQRKKVPHQVARQYLQKIFPALREDEK